MLLHRFFVPAAAGGSLSSPFSRKGLRHKKTAVLSVGLEEMGVSWQSTCETGGCEDGDSPASQDGTGKGGGPNAH